MAQASLPVKRHCKGPNLRHRHPCLCGWGFSMSDIFISYASQDREQAEKLSQALEKHGWSVWWDRVIPVGRVFEDVIEEEIGKARCLIVLWSKNSVGSEWVLAEVHEGVDNKTPLMPVLIEQVKIPFRFRRLHAADLEGWDGSPTQDSFVRLVHDLESALGTPPGSGEQHPTWKQQEGRKQTSKPTAAKRRRKGAPKVDEPAFQTQTARLEKGVEVEFVEIPAGEFEMGSKNWRDDEKPVRQVRISRSFQLGKYPVTQEQWEALMGSNPSEFEGAKRPVETVSWDDVQSFIHKMNRRNDGFEYRLPTEAEWEYSASAGTSGDYAGMLDEMAWHSLNSGAESHPVGGLKPNDWGLYDMHGNVWEWVQDRYKKDYYGTRPNPDTDPQGPEKGSFRVFRGGSWLYPALLCRSAYRLWNGPDYRVFNLGFRLLRQAR